MRKLLYTPVLFVLLCVGAFVACGGGGGPACASTLTVHDIAAQHGTFTSYVTKGGGGGGSHSSGGGSHSSGGGSKAPSNSGSHSNGGKAPSNSGSHSTKVSGSGSSNYKGPATVDHKSYTYTAPGSTTHIVYVHQPTSYYNSRYNAHTVWSPTDPGRFDPYNPWNYYDPFSPYYHVHLASC